MNNQEEFNRDVKLYSSYLNALLARMHSISSHQFNALKGRFIRIKNYLVPLVKARHYSISSSQRVHKKSIHLLIILVGWTTKSEEKRYGHATEYLSLARIGEYITVAIKPSIMKIPTL
jgi:sulfite reductase (NADPH) flavoprotein alpha-component